MQKYLTDPNTKFDIVIVAPFLAGEAGYYLAHIFKAPLALFFTGQIHLPFVSSAMSQPFNPAYSVLGLLGVIQQCPGQLCPHVYVRPVWPSFQETLCHQKPVVAIPVCGDQPVNANEAERLGFGISQPYGSLDETDLYNALDKVLHDPKYKNTAQRLGSALNDQLTKPMDRAVWWIEHIIRHPTMYQGKSPVHKLYWFQYFLLDVLVFYAVVIYVAVKFFKFIICKACCGSERSETKKE